MTVKQTPVDYAEDVLGVHAVATEADDVHAALASHLAVHATAASTIRSLNDRIDAREFELAGEIRSEHPDISQTALERAIKDARQSDDVMRGLRRELRDVQSEQDLAQADIERNKYRLRVLSARMNELGGLLAFYGAAKVSATQRKHE
jgi:hypothetical protein